MINRRSMIKSLGGVSMGSVMPFGRPVFKSRRESSSDSGEVDCDVLVAGGGTAGVVAALQSALAGCSTIIVEEGSQLGGTMTTGGVSFPGLFHAWGKQVVGGIGWELVREAVSMNNDELPDFTIPYGTNHPKHHVRINPALYALLAEERCLQAGVSLHYYESIQEVKAQKAGWEVETMGKGSNSLIRCKQFIDCTGNASAASLAGFELLREKENQPGTQMYRLEGYDFEALDKERILSLYREALDRGELEVGDASIDILHTLSCHGDNAQHTLGADSSTAFAHTRTNIKGRSSLLRMLRFIRGLPACENTTLAGMQTETAVRETYRIRGEYSITLEDYVKGRVFPDALSYSFYPIDLHTTEGVFPDHLEKGTVATVPLRALIPASSLNFLVAGRCVSSDRLANSALRVQASCMGMGQAAGATAALACQKGLSPAEVPVEEIRSLIKKHGGIVPPHST